MANGSAIAFTEHRSLAGQIASCKREPNSRDITNDYSWKPFCLAFCIGFCSSLHRDTDHIVKHDEMSFWNWKELLHLGAWFLFKTKNEGKIVWLK